MRKLFSIIGAVLLSVALHATVVTQDITLSDFSGNATFDGSVITASDNSWQGIYKNDGYSAFALSESHYTDLVVELSAEPDVDVFVQVGYSDASSNDFTISTTQTSGRLTLASANVTSVAIKLVNAGSATLSKVYFYKVVGKAGEDDIFTGPKDLGDNWQWDNRVEVPGSAFAAAHEGDVIRYTYTSLADAQCAVRTKDAENNLIQLANAGEYGDVISEKSESVSCSFLLTATDVANLQSKGLFITGKNMTIQSVTLVTYAQQIMVETELNSGAEVIDWGQHWVHTSGLPTLAAGDELRITVSAVESGQYWQVHFRHDDGGEDAITFGSSDETTPKVYSIALSAEQASNINATGKLLIAGANVTLSRFAIAQPMSIYDERILCSEKHSLDNNWEGGFSIEKEKLSGLKEGNVICLQLTAVSRTNEDDQVLLKYGDGWNYFSPSVNYLFQANNAVASEEIPMTVEIPVTAKMRDQLRNQKLNIAGKNYTVTYVILKEGTPVNTIAAYLNVSDAGMATYVLPFNVPDLPAGVQAYELTNNGDETIWANQVSALIADKPVLIVAAEGEYEFRSEDGASDDISAKTGTYANGALIGTYQAIDPLAETTGANYNYVLNNGTDGIAFYQVLDDGCSVAPYRAYLSCGHNANDNGANFAPMHIVFHKDATTGIESQELKVNSQKLIRNGQVIIIRDNKEFNVFGQQL